MKTFYLLFAILCTNLAWSQFVKVEYDLQRNTTTSTDKTFSAEYKEKVLQRDKKPEKYILYYGNGNSFFKSLPIPVIQHENDPVNVDGNSTTMVEISEKKPVRVYKIKGEDKFYSYKNDDGNEFYKKTLLKFSSVNYKEETQKIDNFVCKLVEVTNASGSITKVWYTEDLPISTGPFAYGEFPGLVLKIETPTFIMYATKISEDISEKDIEKMDNKLKIKE
jgi:GLPGLI family protein